MSGGRRGLGRVYLVGAGPGDPDLVTVRGLRLIRRAEVLLYDRLAASELIAEAPASALKLDVGKVPGGRSTRQEEIHRLLIAHARAGMMVVRLKGGDPFLFGRGGEEALACAAAGVLCEVVPGVSAALAAPASAGIPITHRGVAGSVAILTGHCREGDRIDWTAAARLDTQVVLMGVARLAAIATALVRAGRSPDTPAALVASATVPAERIVVGTLATIAERSNAAGIEAPATLVVGEVVRIGGVLGGLIEAAARAVA